MKDWNILILNSGILYWINSCVVILNYYKDDMNVFVFVYYELKGREIFEVKMFWVVWIFISNKVIFWVVLKIKLFEVIVKWLCKERDDEGELFDLVMINV